MKTLLLWLCLLLFLLVHPSIAGRPFRSPPPPPRGSLIKKPFKPRSPPPPCHSFIAGRPCIHGSVFPPLRQSHPPPRHAFIASGPIRYPPPPLPRHSPQPTTPPSPQPRHSLIPGRPIHSPPPFISVPDTRP
ncbi:hypothetical protein O6P43_001586 [Quillaja saponaria]|uniref:Uncharacterized protein n=1 Tax=Quillaja saponaria TaxID=32244 RepID=A0AAD7VNU2_QUISA|nr:hypothetical protein O6P43_001586 [Quillaja saponaria]